jgi:hypothetical protein
MTRRRSPVRCSKIRDVDTEKSARELRAYRRLLGQGPVWELPERYLIYIGLELVGEFLMAF